MAAREDRWLGRVIGRPAFVVGVDDPVEQPGFYTAKVDADDVAAVDRLERRGFAVVDVNVTLERVAAPGAGPESVPVEPLAAGQEQAVLAIAETAFRYSRFHLDPAIPNEVAARIKREWVQSYVDGSRGVELLVASRDGAPVGFLAVLDSAAARVIDLVAVHPGAQRCGVGRSLVHAFGERHGPSAPALRVGTQVANVPSLRLYAACGYVPIAATYVLHRHVGDA